MVWSLPWESCSRDRLQCSERRLAALYAEMFDTKVRLSGMAIGTQVGFALGGFAPAISATLLGPRSERLDAVAAFTSITAIIASISVATAKETYLTPMEELGK